MILLENGESPNRSSHSRFAADYHFVTYYHQISPEFFFFAVYIESQTQPDYLKVEGV
jgi:hypothetical protein